jgi:hypothetical protein
METARVLEERHGLDPMFCDRLADACALAATPGDAEAVDELHHCLADFLDALKEATLDE